jgi:hypothetical protein
LGFGFWNLSFGFWVLDFGFLGFWDFGFLGFWVFGFLGFWVWVLGFGFVEGSGFRVKGLWLRFWV